MSTGRIVVCVLRSATVCIGTVAERGIRLGPVYAVCAAACDSVIDCTAQNRFVPAPVCTVVSVSPPASLIAPAITLGGPGDESWLTFPTCPFSSLRPTVLLTVSFNYFVMRFPPFHPPVTLIYNLFFQIWVFVVEMKFARHP